MVAKSPKVTRYQSTSTHSLPPAPLWLLPAERPIGRVGFAPTENRRLSRHTRFSRRPTIGLTQLDSGWATDWMDRIREKRLSSRESEQQDSRVLCGFSNMVAHFVVAFARGESVLLGTP